jgi:acetate kinase
MVASLGGVDAVAFTGGVGENAAEVRARGVRGLGFLGLSLDERRNRELACDADISAEHAPVRTVVVRAREDLEIARQVRLALASTPQIDHPRSAPKRSK